MILLIGAIPVVILSGLAALYLQIPFYKWYWHRLANRPVPAEAFVYVVLGDSAAQGIGATRPQKSYVGLVAQALVHYTGRPVHVINLSVSGAQLTDCLHQQLPLLKSIKPDLVTIEIGANDMNRWDGAAFSKGMKALLKQVPKCTVISDIPYFGGGRYRRYEQNVQSAGRIIRKWAKQYNVPVAPLYQTTKEHDGLRIMTIDLLHPSNKGHKNWFNAFWQVIKDE